MTGTDSESSAVGMTDQLSMSMTKKDEAAAKHHHHHHHHHHHRRHSHHHHNDQQQQHIGTGDDKLGDSQWWNALVMILSGMYVILLIVLGFVIPVTEALINKRSGTFKKFEIFYIYLYTVSLLFLVYVYTFLLQKEGISMVQISKKIMSRSMSRLRFRHDSEPSANGDDQDGACDEKTGHESAHRSRTHRHKRIISVATASNHTGSFYLRVGAVGFGLGSMIHSAITFGSFLENFLRGQQRNDVLQVIKPFTHACFTFAQMYFVFMNSKMCIHKFKSLARFGLMHMCGTNICVWLRSVVVETLNVMNKNQGGKDRLNGTLGWNGTLYDGDVTSGGGGSMSRRDVVVVEEYIEPVVSDATLPELKIHPTGLMGKLLESSSVYLFPCTIEYSVICAGVLCVMWSNVGEKDKTSSKSSHNVSTQDGLDEILKTNRIRIDCAGSSQGLFLGLALFVASLCCLIWFYILIGEAEKYLVATSLLGHISEDFIYIATIVALAIASFQMKNMHFTLGLNAGIEGILTLVSLSGLGLYGMFSIVASIYFLDTMDGKLTILTNIIMLVQAGSQATFMLATLSVSAVNDIQARQKPGRNCITFLLVSNFTLWVMNTFETQILEHNVVQVDFYGAHAWSIFTHISVPLGIYYRFHSTVCLSNIWKNAWKIKAA